MKVAVSQQDIVEGIRSIFLRHLGILVPAFFPVSIDIGADTSLSSFHSTNLY